jgi:hypothetical protein
MNKTADYKLEKRSVNNKTLFTEIHSFIEDGILNGGVLWGNEIHRQSYAEIVGEFLDAYADSGKIDQWNVISDLRNNSIREMDKGNYVVEVTYRQKNCLNTTRLIYSIQDLMSAKLKDLLDFTVSP